MARNSHCFHKILPQELSNLTAKPTERGSVAGVPWLEQEVLPMHATTSCLNKRKHGEFLEGFLAWRSGLGKPVGERIR